MLWQLPLTLLGAASTAQGRGIFILPGGDREAISPLNELPPLSDTFLSLLPRRAPPLPTLRIMALGASVTFGAGSSAGNSYRKDLRDMLVARGGGNAAVGFVGEFASGDFGDARVEAQGGFTIREIAGLAERETPRARPNLVLVDAGTNDCNRGGRAPEAGADVAALVGGVFAQSSGVTVVLATVLVNDQDAEQEACRVDVNRQYEALAGRLVADGAKLVLVDMRGPEGPTTADLADRRHPNDVGYQKMARVWLQGIQRAIDQGFITAPAGDDAVPADRGS